MKITSLKGLAGLVVGICMVAVAVVYSLLKKDEIVKELKRPSDAIQVFSKTYPITLKDDLGQAHQEHLSIRAELDRRENTLYFSIKTEAFNRSDWSGHDKGALPVYKRHTSLNHAYSRIFIIHPANVRVLDSEQSAYLVPQYGWDNNLKPFEEHREAQLSIKGGEDILDWAVGKIPIYLWARIALGDPSKAPHGSFPNKYGELEGVLINFEIETEIPEDVKAARKEIAFDQFLLKTECEPDSFIINGEEQRVMFRATRNDGYDSLYTIDPNGKDLESISDKTHRVHNFLVSPSQKHVVYVARRGEDCEKELRKKTHRYIFGVDTSGRNLRQLYKTPAHERIIQPICFLPGEEEIVFAEGETESFMARSDSEVNIYRLDYQHPGNPELIVNMRGYLSERIYVSKDNTTICIVNGQKDSEWTRSVFIVFRPNQKPQIKFFFPYFSAEPGSHYQVIPPFEFTKTESWFPDEKLKPKGIHFRRKYRGGIEGRGYGPYALPIGFSGNDSRFIYYLFFASRNLFGYGSEKYYWAVDVENEQIETVELEDKQAYLHAEGWTAYRHENPFGTYVPGLSGTCSHHTVYPSVGKIFFRPPGRSYDRIPIQIANIDGSCMKELPITGRFISNRYSVSSPSPTGVRCFRWSADGKMFVGTANTRFGNENRLLLFIYRFEKNNDISHEMAVTYNPYRQSVSWVLVELDS